MAADIALVVSHKKPRTQVGKFAIISLDGESCRDHWPRIIRSRKQEGCPTLRRATLGLDQIRIESSICPLPSFVLFLPSDVTSLLARLKKNKAPGLDALTDHHLSLVPSCADTLAMCFNVYTANGAFASLNSWHQSIIVCTPKANREGHILSSQLRPICLFSSIYKLWLTGILAKFERCHARSWSHGFSAQRQGIEVPWTLQRIYEKSAEWRVSFCAIKLDFR